MKIKKLINFFPVLILLFACNLPAESTPNVELISPTSLASTETPVMNPTAVVAYVAFVNGEGISEDLFQANLTQFKQAQEKGFAEIVDGFRPEDIVLDDLINRLLLSQAAQKAGFIADVDRVTERMDQLADELGGKEILLSWIEENGYTIEVFKEALSLEIEVGWQREKISNEVPTSAEQVKARQLFFFNLAQAQSAYGLLESGKSFDSVAEDFDPNNLGYLDWFPRNYLLLPEIENLAFSLQQGEYSEIIETEFGFHILEVLDHDPAKVLTGDALLVLQINALQEWLDEQRAQSQIEVLLP